jgi:large subunit ribosomal protein L6
MGKRPVEIPSGVQVAVAGGQVQVKGPKGELSLRVLPGVEVKVEGGKAVVDSAQRTGNPAYGTVRAHISNMVIGVTRGFSRTLEIVGTGYRAQVDGKDIVFQLGYSHPIRFSPPTGITVKVESPTRLTVSGADRALVGQVAADIRAYRPPEPYKGKGIKYEGEYIRRKAGKAAGAAT